MPHYHHKHGGKKLHPTIIESFLSKDHSVYPPTWTRLKPDPARGAEGLAQELGDTEHIAVAFTEDGHPVACSGVLPFRGENWINEVDKKSDVELANSESSKTADSLNSNIATITDWKICCFCVHPSQRSRGISCRLLDELIAFTRPKGATRLLAADETGSSWP